MITRIHETDLQGRPVRCTGEFFFGQTNSDIVEGMKLNPFTASMSQADFMRQTLAGIGIPIQLADNPELAAEQFLWALVANKYAEFYTEEQYEEWERY